MEKKQGSTFLYVCASCNKDLVAGAFPKWFCLHTNCNNYLKPILNKSIWIINNQIAKLRS